MSDVSSPSSPSRFPRVIALAEGLESECSIVRHALDVVVAEHRARLGQAGVDVFVHRSTAEAVLDLVARRIGNLDERTAAAVRARYANVKHAYIAALQAVIVSAERTTGTGETAMGVWHEIGHALLADAIEAQRGELDHLVELSPSWIRARLTAYEPERRVQELMAWLYAVATASRWDLPPWIDPTLHKTLLALLR
jgi:hypothetical protein